MQVFFFNLSYQFLSTLWKRACEHRLQLPFTLIKSNIYALIENKILL